MSQEVRTISTLHNLLDHNANQFINAEIQLARALPQWINTAGSLLLKNVLQKYHDLVQNHLQQLQIFVDEEKVSTPNIINKVMKAFIEDTDEKLSSCIDSEVKDACLLACIQTINHFKISTYGTAAAFANALDMEQQANVFHVAEINEKQIDDRLSQLAEHEINKKAKTPIGLQR